MPKKSLEYGAALFVAFLLVFSTAMPAQAFYLEVPEAFKQLVQQFKSTVAKAEDTQTQETVIAPDQGALPPQQNFGNGMPPQNGGNQMMPQGQCPNGETGTPPNCSGANKNQFMNGGQPGQNGMMNQGNGNGGQNFGEVKRQANRMGQQLKNMESLLNRDAKKGGAVPSEVKDKLQKTTDVINNLQTNPDAIQNLDMTQLNDNMNSLEDTRQQMQQMDQMKKNLKGLSSPLKMFDKQIAKLQKQGITAPAEVTDSLNQLKAIAEKAKTATSPDQVDGIENIQDLMNTLQDNQQQMELLSRWPQTLKQIDRELSNLGKQLKSSKSLADKLAKKGIDVSSTYTSFADAVDKLKAVREDAVAKVKDGLVDEVFQSVQDDFFGQLPDVYELQKLIQSMSSLSRFQSGYKLVVSSSERTIKKLQGQKIDTADLVDVLNQIKTKGQEILTISKAENFDANEVMSSLQDLENLKQDFQNKVDDLTGGGQVMPWEQGPNQFNAPMMPKFDQMPKSNAEPVIAPTPATEPVTQPTAPTTNQ